MRGEIQTWGRAKAMQAAQQTPNSHLGSDLRALRQRRGLSLQEVALLLGRSVGFVSQIERGLSEPSIDDLRQLARIHDVPLSWFFDHSSDDLTETGHIVRGHSRRKLGSAESGLIEELLSPNLGGQFEIIRSVFSPGAEKITLENRETEEAGYLVSGTLDIEIAGRWYELKPGDSFRFENESYRWRNPGGTDAVVIWVIAPPVY